ncbi:MAG: dephospho-CoA kinase [Lachnospiraceae bacterium]|nr:dephospho-CoA kinase [Lachnospiraceae bacterium]
MKQNKYFVLGITGGIGSGKSLALSYLQNKYNCFVIKADDIGNEVKLKGNACYKDIIKLLGKEIVGEDGEIDKNLMAEKIFADSELVEKVNDIIHPAVRKEIESRIKVNSQDHKIFVIEAALLCEADYFSLLNELWEINATKETRIERLMSSRAYSLEKCESIIGLQHCSEFYEKANEEYLKKTKRKDYFGLKIINNDSTPEDLYEQIDKAMEEINGRF